MKTAVEWLAEQMLYIDNEYDMKFICKNQYQSKRKDIINQAKEMEKQQMKKMYLKGIENYGQTFKQQKQ